MTTSVSATSFGASPRDNLAPLPVPFSLRLKLLLGPLVGWACGCLLVAMVSLLASEESDVLETSLLFGLVGLASGVVGQLPLVCWRMFEIDKLASVLLIGIALRGGVATIGSIGIIKWGIAESGVAILSFVAWYALILIADLFVIIRYINRLAPTPTANTTNLVGGKRSS